MSIQPRLSLMIHTASPDDFLRSKHGIGSYFEALVHNLLAQSFTEFELIYIDLYYEENKQRFASIVADLSLQIKHVPVHPAHRYWRDKGYCHIAAAKNTGILYADGDLCVSCDDGEFFPRDFLAAYWKHFQNGRLMHALHKRLESISLATSHFQNSTSYLDIPSEPIRPKEDHEVYINDHRWKHLGMDFGDEKIIRGAANIASRLGTTREHHHNHGLWLFAGTSFGIDDALRLNGYNERMDGCKSLDDCDFGSRLSLIGKTFAMDVEGFAYILDHPSYVDIVYPMEDGQDGQIAKIPPIVRKKIGNFIAVENHGMLRCSREIPGPTAHVANRHPLTAKHVEIIVQDTLKYRHFDPLSSEDVNPDTGLTRQAMFNIWKNTPTFDLRRQRSELRASTEWKW